MNVFTKADLRIGKYEVMNMFYGWVIVAVLTIGYAALMAPTFYGFGVLLSPMSEGLGLTVTQASGALTIALLINGGAAALTGGLIRRVGARKVMISGSILLFVAGLLLAYVVNNIYTYYLVFMIIGFAGAFTTVIPIQTIISMWFFRKRATAMAIAFTGGSLGSAIIIPVMARILVVTSDWRAVWLMVSALAALAGVALMIFLRNSPEEMGLFPDGANADIQSQSSNTEMSEKERKLLERTQKTTENWETKEAYQTPTIYLLLVSGLTVFFVASGFNAHAINYFEESGFTPALAASVMSIAALFSSGGRLISGYLSDRHQPRLIYITGFAFWLIAIFSLITTPVIPSLAYVYAAAYGLGFGFTYIVLPNLVVNYYGNKNFPKINGYLMMVVMPVSSLAAIIIGVIRDTAGSYNYAWYFAFAFLAVASVAAMFAVPPKKSYVKSVAEKA